MKQNHYTTARGVTYSPETLAQQCGITVRAAQRRLASWKQSDKTDYQHRKLIEGMN